MAVGARISLQALRGLLKVKHAAPSTVGFLLPYVTSFTNSVLQGVDNKSVQNKLLRQGLLAPTETVDDLGLWGDDNATRAWLRKWWLSNTFRGTPRYHSASAALYDTSLLPSLATTRKIFQMKGWKFGHSGDQGADEKRRMAAIAKIEAAGGNLKGLSTIEILEATGCAVDKRGPFNAWCEAHETFEFLTADFVSALSTYLLQRLGQRSSERGPGGLEGHAAVLELGAGSGRLSHFLQQKFHANATSPSIRVVATDSGGWKLNRTATFTSTDRLMEVEKLTFAAALAKYRPKIVLVSWMPMGQDWTKAIRATESVEEYILIGEADDGCCGHNWKTWGNPAFMENDLKEDDREATPLPPYCSDGWTRHNLPELSQLQLCRFDSAEFIGNSCTVSFRRNSPKQVLREAASS